MSKGHLCGDTWVPYPDKEDCSPCRGRAEAPRLLAPRLLRLNCGCVLEVPFSPELGVPYHCGCGRRSVVFRGTEHAKVPVTVPRKETEMLTQKNLKEVLTQTLADGGYLLKPYHVDEAARRVAGVLMLEGLTDSRTRLEAFAAIDTERDYQDRLWGRTASSGRPGSGERTIDEFALYIAGYTNQLVALASTSGDAGAKLRAVRKVAGLCVAAMEQHGAPPRAVWEKP